MTSLGNKTVFSKNLQRYMDKNGVDRIKLCRDLQFKYSTVCEWLSAKKYPRIDKIEKMAAYFGIKKSDLIECESVNQSASEKKVDLTQMTAQEILEYAEKKNETTYDILGYNGKSSKRTTLTKDEYDKVMEIIELMRKNSD